MLFAVLILFVYQPLDAAGHFASKAYQAGDHSLAVRAVAAFDVLGDSLDHDPASGKAPAAQQQIVVGLPCSLACAPLPFVAAHAAWTMLAFVLPPNQIVLELFRPPRA